MALGQLEQHRRAIGTFSSRDEAEHALRELRDSGFPMDRVSVVAKDSSHGDDRIAGTEVTHQVGNKADEGAKTGAITGGALGGLTGLLVGLGFLAIPGIGPVMLAGAGATVLATALSGTAIGAATGGLLGALVGLGIPEERAKVYHDRVAQGHYLVMVEGTDTELRRAEQILNRRGIQEWGVYDASHHDTASTAALGDTRLADRPATTSGDRVLDQTSATPSTHQPGLEVRDTQSIDLYEERLVAEKTRQKTGEVTIGKHVETETVRIETPIERERVIVERVIPEGADKAVALDETSFQSGEILRVEVYEEMPEVHKQVVVREEVNLRKEVTQDVVNAEDTVRREEIHVETEGHPAVDVDRDRLPKDRI
jgi:uncharacterized protein (TIGR02271 family)